MLSAERPSGFPSPPRHEVGFVGDDARAGGPAHEKPYQKNAGRAERTGTDCWRRRREGHNQRLVGATSQPPVWMNAGAIGAFYRRAVKRVKITFQSSLA